MRPKAAARAKAKPRARRPAVGKPRLRPKGSRGAGIGSLWLYGFIAAPAVIALALWRLYVPAALPEPVEPPRPAATEAAARTPEARSEARSEDQVQVTAAATSKEVLAAEFAQAAGKDVAGRAVYWSERLLASPDVRKRVSRIDGAPAIQDTAPLVPALYDCTTFVETVAALARSRREADFYRQLIAIRYNGSEATYRGRNHFPEADWIPNNVKAGILSQLTEEVAAKGGVPVGIEKKRIERGRWLATQVRLGKVKRDLASTIGVDSWKAPQEASVSYVSINDLDKVESHVPDGAIVNLVHRNDEGQPVLISHQGFAVRSGGVLMLRHVTPAGNIRTRKFSEYLKAVYAQERFRWPVLGVNFNRLNDG